MNVAPTTYYDGAMPVVTTTNLDKMNKMRRTAETFARSARKQQEGFRIIAEGWSDAYEGFVISPFDYAQEGIRMFQRAAEQGVTVTQRVVKQGMESTEQITRQGLRIAEEATESSRTRRASPRSRETPRSPISRTRTATPSRSLKRCGPECTQTPSGVCETAYSPECVERSFCELRT
jgi:hypothetical protein